MKAKELFGWVTATGLGLGLGFVAVLQTGMLIEFGFDWKMHWNWIEEPAPQNAIEYVSILVSMLAGGLILGSAQALILRSRSMPVIRWVLPTVVGFGVVAVAIDWPLLALGVLGNIPGPVEPLIVAVGGGSFAGIFQFLTLGRRGVRAKKWLFLWIVGLIAGVVPTALMMISVETAGLTLPWALDVFLTGLIIAGVAALISRKGVVRCLRGRAALGPRLTAESP